MGLFKLKPRAVSVPMKEETVAPKTVDISIRNVLTGKFTPMFGVDAELACALRAAGIAEPYVKPVSVPEPARFWTAESLHTGAPGLHYRKPSGEISSTYGATVTKEALEQDWGVKIPDNVWASFAAKRRPTTGNTELYG